MGKSYETSEQLFAALTLLLPLAGCVDQDSVPSASKTSDAANSEAPLTEVRDTLRMAMSTDLDGLDPLMTTSASTFQITARVVHGLARELGSWNDCGYATVGLCTHMGGGDPGHVNVFMPWSDHGFSQDLHAQWCRLFAGYHHGR